MQSEEVAGEAESFRQMAAGTLDRHVVDEKRYRRRDGSFMWARVNMSVHRDAKDQSQHFISVIEDITERRTLEAQVRSDPSPILATFLHELRGTISRRRSALAAAPSEEGKATRQPTTARVLRRAVGRVKK